MTDLTGQYHRVVVASSFQNLTACEEEQKVMEKFKDMNEMYVSGSREIFKVCKMAVHNSSHPCNDSSIFSMKFFLKIK